MKRGGGLAIWSWDTYGQSHGSWLPFLLSYLPCSRENLLPPSISKPICKPICPGHCLRELTLLQKTRALQTVHVWRGVGLSSGEGRFLVNSRKDFSHN